MGTRLLTLIAVACAGAIATPAAASPISSAAQLFTCCSPEGLQERLFEEAEASGAEQAKLAIKCDMCSGIKGGPACVRACPTGAAIRVSPERFLSVARLAEETD